MKRTVEVIALCAVVAAWTAQPASSTSAKTIQIRGVVHAVFTDTKCPPGTPPMAGGTLTPCFLLSGHGTISGIGSVSERYVLVVLNSGTSCAHAKFNAVLTVRGKGTLDAIAATTRCTTIGADLVPFRFRIVGGTGPFSGATGSGTLTQSNSTDTGPDRGTETDTWVGRLGLAG